MRKKYWDTEYLESFTMGSNKLIDIKRTGFWNNISAHINEKVYFLSNLLFLGLYLKLLIYKTFPNTLHLFHL